jgi:hypothetical protein
MTRPPKIDLFELSDKLLEKLNCNGKFKLTHYDLELLFRRDINYPSDKFNIYLVLFKEELAVSYYTIDYNTIDRIIDILFVHLRDDFGYETIEDLLISTKRARLMNMLEHILLEIQAKIVEHELSNVYVNIDEQYPSLRKDEKGLPIFELQVISQDGKIAVNEELSENYYTTKDKRDLIEKVFAQIKFK